MKKTFEVKDDRESNLYVVFELGEKYYVFKGTLSDCQAYIELKIKGYLNID